MADDASAKVLLANHHVAALPAVGARLRELGISLVETRDLHETLQRLPQVQPDLVVLQPLTPRVDGFEVQEVLRTRTPEQPFALLLVLEDLSTLPELLAVPWPPLNDFLRPPLSEEELVLRIRLALAETREWRVLFHERQSLARESITDFKTGLFNDRYFRQRLREEVQRARRHGLALSLLVLDFDGFKQINDQCDHTFGDFVLESFAAVLRSAIRQIDIPARLGGDEFAVILPNTDLEEAARVATRLRNRTQEQRITREPFSVEIRLSMGLDSLPGGAAFPAEEFLRRADVALLEAKRRGKQRICLYSELDDGAARPASA